MSGLIVVDGGWREAPGIAEATERLMAIKTVVVQGGEVATETSAADELWTINGQVNPTITVRPGERQLWSIANLSNDAFFRLALDGHQMTVVATDGVGVTSAFAVEEWILPPASRVEFLVDPGEAGSYTFRNRFYNEGVFGFAGRALATMVVEGDAVGGLPPVPATIQEGLEDFSATNPDVQRMLVFNSNNLSSGGTEDFDVSWLISDLSFNGGRTDVKAKLGQMEEWTLLNIDVEDHPFHIHQNDFQVTEINGVAQPFTGYRDTVTIPRGGQVKIRQRYTGFVGKWVYHCHILFHEDHGMMGVIEVT